MPAGKRSHIERAECEPDTPANHCNGASTKTVLIAIGSLRLGISRDRLATFDPVLIRSAFSARKRPPAHTAPSGPCKRQSGSHLETCNAPWYGCVCYFLGSVESLVGNFGEEHECRRPDTIGSAYSPGDFILPGSAFQTEGRSSARFSGQRLFSVVLPHTYPRNGAFTSCSAHFLVQSTVPYIDRASTCFPTHHSPSSVLATKCSTSVAS